MPTEDRPLVGTLVSVSAHRHGQSTLCTTFAARSRTTAVVEETAFIRMMVPECFTKFTWDTLVGFGGNAGPPVANIDIRVGTHPCARVQLPICAGIAVFAGYKRQYRDGMAK